MARCTGMVWDPWPRHAPVEVQQASRTHPSAVGAHKFLPVVVHSDSLPVERREGTAPGELLGTRMASDLLRRT
eukprot:3067038-Pyramimonas_sp.AAC.1